MFENRFLADDSGDGEAGDQAVVVEDTGDDPSLNPDEPSA